MNAEINTPHAMADQDLLKALESLPPSFKTALCEAFLKSPSARGAPAEPAQAAAPAALAEPAEPAAPAHWVAALAESAAPAQWGRDHKIQEQNFVAYVRGIVAKIPKGYQNAYRARIASFLTAYSGSLDRVKPMEKFEKCDSRDDNEDNLVKVMKGVINGFPSPGTAIGIASAYAAMLADFDKEAEEVAKTKLASVAGKYQEALVHEVEKGKELRDAITRSNDLRLQLETAKGEAQRLQQEG